LTKASGWPNSDLEIVIAREPLPAPPSVGTGAGRQGSDLAYFNEIATHPPGVRNDRTEKGFHPLKRILGCVFSLTIEAVGYKKNLDRSLRPEEKKSIKLDAGQDFWQGGRYDHRSSKRD
jgi:hypothetical protein